MHIIHSLRRLVKRYPTESNCHKLHCAKSDLEQAMRCAQVEFESHLFSDFNKSSQQVFNYLRSLFKASSIPDNVHLNGGSFTSTPLQRVELFNSFFILSISPLT